MDDYTYAWDVLNVHTKVLNNKSNWIGLELGPGDGLLSAILAHALGSKGVSLVDSGNYANINSAMYQKQIKYFLKAFPDASLPAVNFNQSVEKMLSSVNGNYYTQGLSSLQKLEGS